MKSQDNMYLEVAEGILKDVQAAYPGYRGVLVDKDRLSRLVKHRGQGVYLLDLPCLDDALLSALKTGHLDFKGCPHSRAVSKKIRVPRFLSGLWLRVFDESGCLREDPDATAIAFLRQILCFGKKLRVECSNSRLQETVNEYESIESELREPDSFWFKDDCPHDDSLIRSVHFCDALDNAPSALCSSDGQERETSRDEVLLRECQQVADVLSLTLGSFDPEYVFSDVPTAEARGYRLKHGPGAVSDRTVRRDIFDKYSFPNWPVKLANLFPYYPYGSHPYEVARDRLDPEPAAKLIAVPKTAKAPRLIASEPTAHQWCQQAVRSWLERQIKGCFSDFITLKKQSLSAELVVRASKSGYLSTIDLSSASDRLSLWSVHRMFRNNPDFIRAIHSVRTRFLSNHIKGTTPFFLVLKKAFTQGTAITFPTQSLFFLICALSVMPGKEVEDKVRAARGRVRVYGDDIIVPTYVYADLVRLLELLGLKVNEKKSFSTGLFRESCGSDAYRGYDVTPVKPKSLDPSTPTGRSAVIDTSNNLFKKGYWNAASAMDRQLGKWRESIPVMATPVGSLALFSFVGDAFDHLSRRYNAVLHRYEYRIRSIATSERRRTREELSKLKERYLRVRGKPQLLQLLLEADAGLARSDSTVLGTRDRVKWEPLWALK